MRNQYALLGLLLLAGLATPDSQSRAFSTIQTTDPFSEYGEAWSNESNASVFDNYYAFVLLYPALAPEYSQYLTATNATTPFSIPAGATINGINATFTRRIVSPIKGGGIADYGVSLVQEGSVLGENKVGAVDWQQNVSRNDTYGNATDLWGLSWSPSQINSFDFGVAIAASGTGVYILSSAYAQINYINVTVFFTNATSSCTYTSGNWLINSNDNCNISGAYALGSNSIFVYGTSGRVNFTNFNFTGKQITFNQTGANGAVIEYRSPYQITTS